MTIPPTGLPPDQDQAVPASIRAALAEPLAAASGRSGVDALAREIEENDDDRRSTGSGTRVDSSDVESVKEIEVDKAGTAAENVPEEKALGSHHSNGLEDQTAYLYVLPCCTTELERELMPNSDADPSR
jgi:hypothetical protein